MRGESKIGSVSENKTFLLHEANNEREQKFTAIWSLLPAISRKDFVWVDHLFLVQPRIPLFPLRPESFDEVQTSKSFIIKEIRVE